MMRKRLLFFIAVSCAFCLPYQQTHAQELRRILYGTTASPSQLPVLGAKDAGYFEKHGLNVEPVQIRGGSLYNGRDSNGEFAVSGAGANLVARLRGRRAVKSSCLPVRWTWIRST
jgi:hypothetical protein